VGLRLKLGLPKEHGAWAMLYVPLAAGALVAGSFPIRLLLLILSATLVFVARESLIGWVRAWKRRRPVEEPRNRAILYLALGAVAGAPLLIVGKLYWLAAMGLAAATLLAFNTIQSIRREDRTIAGEIIAIAGLTLTAPAAYYVAGGSWDVTALWLWMLCALYFASSVFYVKARVHALNPRQRQLAVRARRSCTVYHAVLALVLLILALTCRLDTFVLIAFSPIMVRSFWYLARPSNRVNLRRVGVIELMHSAIFLLFVTLTFRA